MAHPTDFKVDLSNCDREPIHLLGKIQSHGILVGFHKITGRLTFYSENALGLIVPKDVAASLVRMSAVLPDALNQHFEDFIKAGSRTFQVPEPLSFPVEGGNRLFKCHLSDGVDHIIIECEALDDAGVSGELRSIASLNNFVECLGNLGRIEDMAAEACVRFRAISGYDRVMVYKFDENGDGEVIGEDKRFGLESFLGLRYPASDIPAQARQLYKTNLLRVIRDVEDPGVGVVAVDENAILDLSHTVFRHVSPVHIEYLKNMGVRATHASSIMVGDELWGMLISHHYDGPRQLSMGDRTISLLYAQSISTWLVQYTFKQKVKRETGEDRLLGYLKLNPHSLDLYALLKTVWSDLKDLLKIDGFALKTKSSLVSWPASLEVNVDGFGMEDKPGSAKAELAFIDQLEAREIAEGVAGLARLRLSEEQPMELYLFRKEKTLVFNWAGNPQKPVEVAEGEGFARLSPRTSFELWQEQVRGYSLPWTYLDKDFVNRLKEVLSLQFYGERQVSASGKHAIKLIQHERDQLNRRIFILEEKLTDLEKAHQDGLIMLKDAKKLTMAKSDLVGNLSHEMRTPLNGILGFAQLLLKEDSDKAKRYGQLILDCGQRMLDTFENLMRYSRIEHESLEAHSESGNLEDLVQAVIQSLEGEAFAKDQELSVVIHNKKTVFLADRLLIGQILKNLLGNAIKFTPAGGKVEVNAKVLTEKDQHYLNLSVEDNGEGIPADKHGQIFDPFYTVHKQEKMKDNSSGLGLYLVKSYVDFLHGYINLESKVGTGSRFSVILPIQLKEDV